MSQYQYLLSPTSDTATQAGTSSYGVLLCETVQNQGQGLVDLRIQWANDWVLTTCFVAPLSTLSGWSLSALFERRTGFSAEFLTGLTETDYASIELLTINNQWLQCRITRLESGYLVLLEPIATRLDVHHPATMPHQQTPAATTCAGASSTKKEAEPDLLLENWELKVAFDQALSLQWIADQHGTIRKVNRAWEAALGYTGTNVPAMNYIDLVHPDDRHLAVAKQVDLTAAPVSQRIRLRKKDGSYLSVDWCLTLVDKRLYMSGWIVAAQQTKADLPALISYPNSVDCKQAAETLREREQRFRTIFNLTYQLMGLMTPEGILLEANDTALQIGGQTTEDVIGKPFWETYWWQRSDTEQQRLRRAIQQAAQGELVRYEVEVWNASRETLVIDLSIKPVFNERGEVVLLIPEGRDITNEKQAENALRESEQRFREIAENVNDAFWIHSAEPFKLLYVNPAFERGSGLSAQCLADNPELLFEAVVDEDRPQLMAAFNAYRQGAELTGHYRLRRADNTIRWFNVRTFIMRDCQDLPLRYIGVASDITSQKEKELVLQQALVREQELNKLKSHFVATVSHEFRTPLATMQSSLDLVGLYLDRSKEIDKPAIDRHLAIIDKEISAFSELLSDVLTIGKMEEGKVAFNPRHVDIVAHSQAIIATHFSHHADLRTVQLTTSGKPYQVCVDDKLIGHVLINLLANAFKFSTGNPELHIAFKRKQLLISISDRGIGIPEADLPSLFQPFFRARNASTIQGTGLGLAISRQFVELHTGSLTVISKEKQGTIFTIQLPVPPSARRG